MINLKSIIGSDQPPATNLESLKIIYTEVTNVIHTCYEWRYKVISRYIAASSAVVVSLKWILEHPSYRDYLPVILLFFAIVSVVVFLMDNVNTAALTENYKLAKCLEKEMSKPLDFSVYESAHTRYVKFEHSKFLGFFPKNFNSYATILFWVYLGSAFVSLGFAIYFYLTLDSTCIEPSPSPDNKCFCCTEISESRWKPLGSKPLGSQSHWGQVPNHEF